MKEYKAPKEKKQAVVLQLYTIKGLSVKSLPPLAQNKGGLVGF